MSLIPDSLDKYFRSRSGKIMKDNTYVTILNYHLRKQMQIGETTDVTSIEILDKPNPEFFKITEDTCDLAFSYSSWSKLRDNEKARTISIYINKYMKEHFPDLHIPSLNFIHSKEFQHYNVDGLYCESVGFVQDYIYINPRTLSKSDGLHLINIISHELQHCHDFNEAKNKIVPLITRLYVSDKENAEEEIMNLPLDGLIRNLKTGKYENINPKLRQQILTAKISISPVVISDGRGSMLHAVSNEKSMYRFMQYIAYRRSPLEQRAYNAGADTVEELISKLESINAANKCDYEILENERKSIKYVADQAEKFKHLTGIATHEVCDMFSRYNYYSRRAQFNPDKFGAKATELHNELLKLASSAYAAHYASIEAAIKNL